MYCVHMENLVWSALNRNIAVLFLSWEQFTQPTELYCIVLYCIDTDKLYIHSWEVNLMNLWNKVCNVMSCRGSTDCPPQLPNFNPTWYFCVGLLQRSLLWHKASNPLTVPARNWTVLNSPPSNDFGSHLPLTLPSVLPVSQTWQWSFWTPALLPHIHKGQWWYTYWFYLLNAFIWFTDCVHTSSWDILYLSQS
jgi:hypothetical protein